MLVGRKLSTTSHDPENFDADEEQIWTILVRAGTDGRSPFERWSGMRTDAG